MPSFGGTHASGGAGQHFELFGSTLCTMKKSHHTQSLSARTVCKVVPRVRYRTKRTNELLLIAAVFFMNPIPSFIQQISIGWIRPHADWRFSLANKKRVECVSLWYFNLIKHPGPVRSPTVSAVCSLRSHWETRTEPPSGVYNAWYSSIILIRASQIDCLWVVLSWRDVLTLQARNTVVWLPSSSNSSKSITMLLLVASCVDRSLLLDTARKYSAYDFAS